MGDKIPKLAKAETLNVTASKKDTALDQHRMRNIHTNNKLYILTQLFPRSLGKCKASVGWS